MQICGCDVVDYDRFMIMDGYVLVKEEPQEEVLRDRYFEIRHVKVVSVDPDFRERQEKVTCRIKVVEHTGDDFKNLFSSPEEVVEVAKEKLAKKCKRTKKLLVDNSVVSHFKSKRELEEEMELDCLANAW